MHMERLQLFSGVHYQHGIHEDQPNSHKISVPVAHLASVFSKYVMVWNRTRVVVLVSKIFGSYRTVSGRYSTHILSDSVAKDGWNKG